MKSTNLIIDERYEFLWPKRKPAMRMVGPVVKKTGEGYSAVASVRFDPGKELHDVILSQALIQFADPDEPDGLWVKQKRAKLRG